MRIEQGDIIQIKKSDNWWSYYSSGQRFFILDYYEGNFYPIDANIYETKYMVQGFKYNNYLKTVCLFVVDITNGNDVQIKYDIGVFLNDIIQLVEKKSTQCLLKIKLLYDKDITKESIYIEYNNSEPLYRVINKRIDFYKELIKESKDDIIYYIGDIIKYNNREFIIAKIGYDDMMFSYRFTLYHKDSNDFVTVHENDLKKFSLVKRGRKNIIHNTFVRKLETW